MTTRNRLKLSFQPVQRAGKIVVTGTSRPLAVSDDNPFAIPAEDLCACRPCRCTGQEGQTPFKRRPRLAGNNAIEKSQRALPPAPMLLQEAVAECLDEVGDDHGARGPVKKDDLIHRKRTPKPRLVDQAAIGQARFLEAVPGT